MGAASVDIELVAYGPGIGMLKLESPVNSRVAEAIKSGVKVLACENTMRGQKLTRGAHHPALEFAADTASLHL